MALYVKNFRELADCNRNSSSQNVERTEPSALCASYDFVLPLCLKSIVLRFATEKETLPTSTKALVDDGHLTLLESFVETLVHGLMQEACDESSSALEQDTALRKADKSAGTVLDFLVGLLSVVHTRHVRGLLETFFKAIRDAESRALERIYHVDPHLSHRMLHRAKCYRQLRLCALETLASLPAFIALNSPMKFAARLWSQRPMQTTWLHQFRDSPSEGEEIGTSNVSGWLVRIVLGEALSICAVCSHAVLEEAISTIELSLVDALPSALKKRHGLGLDRSDLLALQSMAIHAINVVYELAIRRHVLDRRFQSETSRTRVAGLVALPILDHSIASTRWLSKMEATHKVRSIWLLCFAYVLQEAPEAQIYDFVRSCYNNSASFCLKHFVGAL
jgi:hypothetical protein